MFHAEERFWRPELNMLVLQSLDFLDTRMFFILDFWFLKYCIIREKVWIMSQLACISEASHL